MQIAHRVHSAKQISCLHGCLLKSVLTFAPSAPGSPFTPPLPGSPCNSASDI